MLPTPETIEKVKEKSRPLVKKVVDLLKLDTTALEQEKSNLSAFESALDRHHIISHRTRSKEADLFRFLRTQILQGQ